MTSANRELAVQDRPAHWFKPGQSGNPTGRPKDMIGALIRQYDVTHDFDVANEIRTIGLDSKQRTRDRLTALIWWEEKGWGKAPQQIIYGDSEGDGHKGVFDNLPMPKLQALLHVLDTLDDPSQLDELLRLAQAPVIEGKGGALDVEQEPEE